MRGVEICKCGHTRRAHVKKVGCSALGCPCPGFQLLDRSAHTIRRERYLATLGDVKQQLRKERKGQR